MRYIVLRKLREAIMHNTKLALYNGGRKIKSTLARIEVVGNEKEQYIAMHKISKMTDEITILLKGFEGEHGYETVYTQLDDQFYPLITAITDRLLPRPLDPQVILEELRPYITVTWDYEWNEQDGSFYFYHHERYVTVTVIPQADNMCRVITLNDKGDQTIESRVMVDAMDFLPYLGYYGDVQWKS